MEGIWDKNEFTKCFWHNIHTAPTTAFFRFSIPFTRGIHQIYIQILDL